MWILAIQTTEADSLILIMMINWIFREHAGICTSKLLPRLCLAQQQFPHQHRTKQRTGPLCWVPCHHHRSRGRFPGDQMVQPLCEPARRWMQVFSFSMIASLQRLSTQWGPNIYHSRSFSPEEKNWSTHISEFCTCFVFEKLQPKKSIVGQQCSNLQIHMIFMALTGLQLWGFWQNAFGS